MNPCDRPFVRERDGFILSGEIWKVDGREDLSLFTRGGVTLKNPRSRKEAANGERGIAVDAKTTVGVSHP
jgi:hypothetical protein